MPCVLEMQPGLRAMQAWLEDRLAKLWRATQARLEDRQARLWMWRRRSPRRWMLHRHQRARQARPGWAGRPGQRGRGRPSWRAGKPGRRRLRRWMWRHPQRARQARPARARQARPEGRQAGSGMARQDGHHAHRPLPVPPGPGTRPAAGAIPSATESSRQVLGHAWDMPGTRGPWCALLSRVWRRRPGPRRS